MIGGGSVTWTPNLAKDLFLREGLDGSELVLVDIDPEAAQLLKRFCEAAVSKLGCNWTISVADLDNALLGDGELDGIDWLLHRMALAIGGALDGVPARRTRSRKSCVSAAPIGTTRYSAINLIHQSDPCGPTSK